VKFRKKPVVIEAIQWTRNVDEIRAFVGDAAVFEFSESGPHLTIKTLEGIHEASPNDFIIRGVKGEFYPCKPDIFEATYEAVREVTHYPDGMGEESRRLHREYNALVAAQRAGAKNGAEVVRVTDEAAAKGIILVPNGENL
jgi:hypothetical protein